MHEVQYIKVYTFRDIHCIPARIYTQYTYIHYTIFLVPVGGLYVLYDVRPSGGEQGAK